VKQIVQQALFAIRCNKAQLPLKIGKCKRLKQQRFQQTSPEPFPFSRECYAWNNF
jgi:hypothetical protein